MSRAKTPIPPLTKPAGINFNTDELPPAERFNIFRQAASQLGEMKHHFTSPEADHFECVLEAQPLGSVDLIDLKRNSHFISTLTEENARHARERLNIQICRTGTVIGEQGGNSLRAEPGMALFLRSHLAGASEYLRDTRMQGVFVDLDRVRPLLKAELPISATMLPPDNPALKLLSAWLTVLLTSNISLDQNLKAIIEMQIIDLVVLVMNPRDDAREEAESRTGRLARMHAVLDQIAARSHQQISAEDIGSSLGISERYVRLLLEETGTTFSEHVLEQRLLRAFRLLNDPRRADEKIADIALKAGFSDISHFNRTFRARFGDTPSATRASVLRRKTLEP